LVTLIECNRLDKPFFFLPLHCIIIVSNNTNFLPKFHKFKFNFTQISANQNDDRKKK
jgi:hypothetical protein